MPLDESDCQPWPRAKSSRGYGYLRVGNKMVCAHRHAWEQRFGPIPEGLHVLHRCDNPSCVNLDHLYLGTHQDNMDDMRNRGRRFDGGDGGWWWRQH